MRVQIMLHPYTKNIKEKAVNSLHLKQNQMMRAQQVRLVKYHVKESCQKWQEEFLNK